MEHLFLRHERTDLSAPFGGAFRIVQLSHATVTQVFKCSLQKMQPVSAAPLHPDFGQKMWLGWSMLKYEDCVLIILLAVFLRRVLFGSAQFSIIYNPLYFYIIG